LTMKYSSDRCMDEKILCLESSMLFAGRCTQSLLQFLSFDFSRGNRLRSLNSLHSIVRLSVIWPDFSSWLTFSLQKGLGTTIAFFFFSAKDCEACHLCLSFLIGFTFLKNLQCGETSLHHRFQIFFAGNGPGPAF